MSARAGWMWSSASNLDELEGDYWGGTVAIGEGFGGSWSMGVSGADWGDGFVWLPFNLTVSQQAGPMMNYTPPFYPVGLSFGYYETEVEVFD